MMLAEIDLTIPDFLRAENRPPVPPYRYVGRQSWHMPPKGLSKVLGAVTRGHDTLQKIRAVRGIHLTDAEIGKCLQSLKGRGVIIQTGRRYTINRA